MAATPDSSTIQRFACEQCHLCFYSKKDANRHKLGVHDKLTPYFCDEPGCPRERGFTRKDNLEQHRRLVHGKTNPSASLRRINRQPHSPKRRTADDLSRLSKNELVALLIKERESAQRGGKSLGNEAGVDEYGEKARGN